MMHDVPAQSGPGTPVLAVADLHVSFLSERGWQEVLHGVSFDVGAKSTVAVVGESGSGKSVTALSVMGLLPRSNTRVSGSVRLAGKELLHMPEKVLNGIRGSEVAMIFQEPMTSLNPVLTIGDQLGESLRIHRGMGGAESRRAAVELLEKVRIPAARSRVADYPHSFSGGMRQRVMIAMALACKPKLLIADEPTTALDVTIQAQILDLIKTLQREEDMSVLFITHDMGVVAEIADRAIVMYKGEAVEKAQTGDLFRAPQHGYTRRLLAAVPRLGAMRDQERPLPFPVIGADGKAEAPARPSSSAASAEARPATPVLDVQNLVKRFDVGTSLLGQPSGRVHAVENVSFSVRAGQTMSIVGESGCGKSTTGRAVLNLIKPDSGAVLFEGRDLISATPGTLRRLRRGMQMIFQDPFASLNPRMSIGRAVAEPMRAHGLASRREASERVAELLQLVGLSPDMAKRYPHEFSGGQRQRICIARALGLEPKLIVADESVSALDVSVKAQVVNLMMELQERLGLAYLFISHDMAVVERMSHEVAVMYLGEIVEHGPRAAVFENPQHPYTKRLLSAVPVPDPARRNEMRAVSNDEIKSPIRPLDYVPPQRSYRQVSHGHFCQEWGAEWEGEAA